jgi:capsular exopolysaccharide synthesis family protein
LSEFLPYLLTLRRRKGMVVATIFLSMATAVSISIATAPVYQASARLLVLARPQPGADIESAYAGALLSKQLVRSFAKVLESRPTAVEALRRRPEAMDAQTLQQNVNAEVIPNTQLIVVTVNDNDPLRVQRLTNNLALALLEQSTTIQAGSIIQLSLVEPAATPQAPTEPQTMRNLLFGLILGSVIGIGFALFAEHLDTSIKSPDELEKVLKVPVLGIIPALTRSNDALPVADYPTSIYAEAFRVLRTNLCLLGIDSHNLCCVVTSPSLNEGKSTITANLARTIAHAGQRVIVVDANLRNPSMHEAFQLQQQVGITTILLDRIDIVGALQCTDDPSLRVLTSGPIPPNPSELLNSQRMADLINRLRQSADIVLIDSPPILPVTDPMLVAQLADGVLLVARAGKTSRDHAQAANATCDRVGAKLLGTVLNAAQEDAAIGPSCGYYGQYTAHETPNGLRGFNRSGNSERLGSHSHAKVRP